MIVKTGIRFYLIFLVACCMLPIYGISFYNYKSFGEQRTDKSKIELQIQAQATAASIDQAIRSAANLLLALQNIPQLRDLDNKNSCSFLATFLTSDSRYSEGYIVRPDGHVYCISVPENVGGNESNKNYFRKALTSGKVEVGLPTICNSNGKFCFPVALALRDDSGKVTSVLALNLDPIWLSERANATWIYPDNTLMVCWDGEARVAFAWPQTKNFFGKFFSNNTMGIQMLNKSTGNFSGTGIDGKNKLFGFSTIRGIGHPDMKLSLGVSEKTFLAPTREYLIKNLTYLIILTLLVIVISWGLGTFFIRKMTDVVNMVKHMGDHNRRRHSRAPYLGVDKRRGCSETNYTNDEFGMLAYAINTFEEKQLASVRESNFRFRTLIERLSDEATLYKLDKGLLSKSPVGSDDTWLKTTLENMVEGVSLFDIDGQLLYCNPAGINMYGFSGIDEYRLSLRSGVSKTFEFASLEGILWPEEQLPLARILRGEDLHNMNIHIRNIRAGWQKILNYYGTIINNTDNKPLLVVIIMRDVTSNKN